MQTATEMTQPQVHPTPPREAVQRVILPGVSWSTYEALLADMQDSHAVHFAYDQGMLEIMAPSYEHESVKGHLALLVTHLTRRERKRYSLAHMKQQPIANLYSDYLLASFGPTTATGLSELLEGEVSHDQVTRYLAGTKKTATDLWQTVKSFVREVQFRKGC